MSFLSSVRTAPVQHSSVALGVAAALASFLGVSAQAAQEESLEPIVVTATRNPSSWQTAPVGATVITADQIVRSGVADANEAISRLAGVPSRTDLWGGHERALDLRGYGSTAQSNMVVLVNGVRISENEDVAARLSAIPLNQIERIEVLRGGSSVLWGEGASAGVINVILKDQVDSGTQGHVYGDISSFNGREVGADANWGLGAWGLDASIKRLRNGGYRDNSAYAQDVGSVGVQWAQSGLHARARIQQEDQDARMPGALTFDQYAANRKQTSSPNDWAHTYETRYIGNVGFERGDWAWDLDLGTRDRRSQYQFSPSPVTTSKSRQTQLSPHVTYDGAVGGFSTRTIFGLDLQSWQYSRNVANGTEEGTQNNHAEFFQSDWSLPTRTRVVFGARHEHVEKQDNYPGAGWDSPVSYSRPDGLKAHELSVSQTLITGLDGYVRTASSYRLPNIDENRLTTAQSALRPQRNRDTEAGVKWSQAGQSATLRWFKQRTVDEIGFDPINYVNANLDPTRRQGIELEARSKLSDRLELSGTWQHLKARYTSGPNAGKEPVLVAPYTATIRAAYNVDDQQSVSVGMQYVAPSRFGDDNDNTCAKRIPSYRPIDTTYRWSDKVWTVVASAANLADQKTYNYAYSCTTGYLYPEPGRSLKLTVSRAF
ncbi:MAG: TonB-dependent receptor [Burkholderiales bacterium]|nr:TonB-dependent receptor [Burkholderiales bacterium]